MTLLPQQVRQQLSALYSQEHVNDPMVYCKFFTPDSTWTWYATEFDGEDIFFGWVVGFEKELGYFTLHELEETRGPLGLPIERDLHFIPKPLSQVKQEHGTQTTLPDMILTVTFVEVDTMTLADALSVLYKNDEVNPTVTEENPHPIAGFHQRNRFVVRRWNGTAWEDALNNNELEEEVALYATEQYGSLADESQFPILKTTAAKAQFSHGQDTGHADHP